MRSTPCHCNKLHIYSLAIAIKKHVYDLCILYVRWCSRHFECAIYSGKQFYKVEIVIPSKFKKSSTLKQI